MRRRGPAAGLLATLSAGAALLAVSSGLAALVPGCGATPSGPRVATAKAPAGGSVGAWEVVYSVLQHPRCMNCHPSGDVPLQGDASLPHLQNVQRGAMGRGRYALRCDACHGESNLPGPHLPPGAPNWHLPRGDEPLVFQGRSTAELCRQLKDPAQNGGKTLEALFHHMAEDPLVLWGWDPGEGRQPVGVPHAQLVAAMRAWIDGGCECPEP